MMTKAKAATRTATKSATKTLFTIGYENTPAKAVLDELQAAGVKLLVHLRRLGTPKEGREAALSGQYDTLHKIYSAHLKTPQAREQMDELAALVKSAGPVCLLCYERDHAHCHRQWIAEIIEDRDQVRVENLVAPQV